MKIYHVSIVKTKGYGCMTYPIKATSKEEARTKISARFKGWTIINVSRGWI